MTNQLQKKKWFFRVNGKPVVPRKNGAGFIVFEGLDGSGQSTQAQLLKDFLMKKGYKIHPTKEPTPNLIGGLIKSQLTHEWKSSQECLQLLFSADRAYHLEKEIIPLLKKGITVICDRYFFSTIAYGATEIKDWDWLIRINQKFLLPDIIFLLKVSPRICLQRISKSRFEVTLFEKEKTLEKVLKNYLRLANEFKNIYVIDGEKSIKEVQREIQKIVLSKLNF